MGYTDSENTVDETRWLYLVRHCHREDLSDGSVSREWLQSAERPYDPDLSPVGTQQAENLARYLCGAPVHHLFSSPYLRTVNTAHKISEALGLSIYIEEGIGEWLNPAWFSHRPQVLPPETLAEKFPAVDTGYRSRGKRSFPEKDECEDAWPAIARTAIHLLDEFQGNLLIVGHGASIAGVMDGLIGNTPVATEFGSIVRLVEGKSGWRFHSHDNIFAKG